MERSKLSEDIKPVFRATFSYNKDTRLIKFTLNPPEYLQDMKVVGFMNVDTIKITEVIYDGCRPQESVSSDLDTVIGDFVFEYLDETFSNNILFTENWSIHFVIHDISYLEVKTDTLWEQDEEYTQEKFLDEIRKGDLYELIQPGYKSCKLLRKSNNLLSLIDKDDLN